MMEIISEDQFIQACCHYLLHEDSSLLKNTTHFFVENTVVGNKDFHKISSIFGSSFPFIKQILFDNNNDIIDQKNEFLYLLKFFVKTGYFDDLLVNDDEFIKNLFGLLTN